MVTTMNATERILECGRDGEATRLTCAGCGAPICPRCMSRTPVGYKCPDCVTAGAGAGRSMTTGPRRRWWVLAGVGVAALLAAALLRTGDGDTVDPVGAPAAGAPAPAGQTMLGEEVNDGQLTFTVTAFSCGETQIGSRVAEGKFCSLHLRAHNRSRGPATVLGRFQHLLDERSKTYGPDLTVSQAVGDNGGRALAELQINPELTVDMILVYDVPPTLEPLEAQLRGTGAGRFGVRVRLQPRAG